MKTLGIIPSRYASSRFPGKPLVDIGGRSMIERVYRQVSLASLIDEVIVGTDDERIFDHVRSFGGRVDMTDPAHRSGTDRCAELARKYKQFDIVVNIQGDEPFIDPAQIDAVILPLRADEASPVATLAKKIEKEEDLFDPNVVKVVINARQNAMYFSRSTIPYLRNYPREQWLQNGRFYKHLGLYAFRRKTLLALSQLPAGGYEQLESLEQLRWLEAGTAIHVGITDKETIGIDKPEDLNKIDKFL